MTPERIRGFFTHIGVHASAHPMEANRYSLSTTDLHAALLGGARAATRRYGLPESWATRMEDDGCITSWPDGDPRVGESIPRLMLRSSATRSEMGLNFGGNHFLELQAVDRIVDAETAARWGLRAGQLVVMYHLGPGTFGGTLLHHLSRRLKTSRERVPVYFTAKLLFHYLQRARQGRLWDKWGLHFRRNEFTAIPAESDAGKLFRRALTMATNVGSAYRMATVRAVLDGLASAITPGVRAELLCDVSHNGIHQDADAGGHLWTARHNACRLVAGAPTIVAGSSDVPSYLGLGDSGHGEQLIDSYDHGAGHLIELARGTADATPADGHVLRVRMDRGRNARVLSTQRVPMRSAGPIERLMECFEAHRAMRPVVRLRPIATLKN